MNIIFSVLCQVCFGLVDFFLFVFLQKPLLCHETY